MPHNMIFESGPLLEIMDGSIDAAGNFSGRAIITGEAVLDYQRLFGVNMLRPADEIFSPETMDSTKMIPVTLGHPPKNLTAETTKDYVIGMTGEQVERIGNKMAVNFKIWDSWVVKKIQKLKAAGKRIQFSLGANALPDLKAGVFQDKAYQAIQRKIRNNHLAILLDENGRYPETQLLDSQDSGVERLFVMDGELLPENIQDSQEEQTVKKKLPNGAEIEVSDADGHYLDNHLTEYTDLKNKYAKQAGELQTAKNQLEQAKTQVMDSAAIDKAITSRLTLALEAQTLMDSTSVEDIAAMSEREIYEAVAIADGFTAEELQAQAAELKDSYPAFLSGVYSQIVKNRGAAQSREILDAAGKGSTVTRATQAKGTVVVSKFGEAKKAMQQRMEEQRKGVAR